MKLKVKVSKDLKVLVDLNEDEATIANVKIQLIEFLHDSKTTNALEFDTIQFSLNGKDPISTSDDDYLSDCGVVHGDLLTILNDKPQVPTKSTSVKMEKKPTKNNDVIPVSNNGSDGRPERPTFVESFPIMESMFDMYKPSSLGEGLVLIIHSNMLETGFICDTANGNLPEIWKSPVVTIQYKHNGYNNFICTLVVVTMGDIRQVMVSFPSQLSEISIKLILPKYVLNAENIATSSFKKGELSRKIKNELLYPLQVAAHDRLGLPAPWHLAGLPSEVLVHTCLSYLDIKSILNLSMTCNRLKDVLNDNTFWRKLCKRQYSKMICEGNEVNWKEKYKQAHMKEKTEKRFEAKINDYPNYPLPQPMNPYAVPFPAPGFPRGVYGDPDSPYFSGEIPTNPHIPNPLGPIGPRIINDSNPLGPIGPSPMPPDPFQIGDPFGLGRRDPFNPSFVPSMNRRGGGRGGLGPGFHFF